MTGEDSPATLRADLDAHVDALARTDAGFLREEVTPPPACADRWYGRLAVRAFEATAGEAPIGADVRSAAAGVELLRAYHEGRTALLIDERDDASGSTARRMDRSLLVGDYRFAAAFRALEPVEGATRSRCFEALVEAACSIVEATARYSPHTDPTTADRSVYAEETAGALGATAIHVGTTLAGAESGRLAEFGRYVATARRLERFRAGDLTAGDDPTAADAAALGDAVNRYRREAERAFREAGRPAPLGPFLDSVADG